MKSIIVIFTLSACIFGTTYAAPYPGSSEIALLNGMTSAKQMQGDYNIGGETIIQERKDAEAQFFGTIAASILLPLVINALTGSVTIQTTEDVNDLQTLLANIESSSMDEEAKVQVFGALLRGALKLGPKAFRLLKAGGKKAWDFAEKLTPGLLISDLVSGIGGSTQTQESEDNPLQMLQDTSSNSMKEEADAQGVRNTVLRNTVGRFGKYLIKKTPKLIDYIKAGTVGTGIGIGADWLRRKIFGRNMMVQASGEAVNVPRYEKLFELLNQLEAERDLKKDPKAAFFAAGLPEDSPGK